MTSATQSASPAGVPQRFGHYWLDAVLAEGGMARVMLAHLRGPGGFEKKLVVKQILPQLARDPGFVELFVREANTLVQMSHPNIVPVYELGVVDGVYFLAMERVDGATVAELLAQGALPEALCAHVAAQVCDALQYAHERFGLVHRDVTPRNVIADGGGHVRLLDFGIAAPPAHDARGERFGSPGYMSPEQARGEALSPRSDLFSLGALLFQALTSEHALTRDANGAQTDAPPRPLGAGAGIDAELAHLVSELLQVDPARRPESAGEVGGRLRAWLSRHHPQGVARELGLRVERARARAAVPRPNVASEPSAPQSHTPRMTKTLATSPKLTEMLSVATEPLAQEERDGRAKPRRRRTIALWLAAAAVLAVVVARFRAEPATAPRAPRREMPAAQPVRPRAEPPPESNAAAAAESTRAATRAQDAPDAATALRPSIAAQGRAELSVNALPWAELRLDGRALGTTPKRGLSVSAGRHLLQLDCPPLGRSARVPLKLDPSDRRRVLVDLNVDPPTVHVD